MTRSGEPFDVDVLATELSDVATAGFGREVRKGRATDQLDGIARALVADSTVPKIAQHEEAILPSIARLGKGRYGKLARGIYGLTAETEALSSRKRRKERLEDELHIGEHALDADLKKMFRALAEDLIYRFTSLVAS